MFSGVEEMLCARDGDPLAGRAIGTGFVIFGVIVAALGSLKAKLDHRRGGIINRGLELRLGSGLEPEQTADTHAHGKNHAGNQRAKALQFRME